ncbi:MAG: hypothetical protein DCC48_16050 [Acidobacteria bacterium]|nr:MAG: hypothetical protein DCC48_16050 [Acidobacteriota bacterium]
MVRPSPACPPMTTTYDPFHPNYFDEGDLRQELTRVYDLCHGCRLCFKFCSAFPTLFDLIDEHEDQDASKLTVAEQDQVIDLCFQCKLCYLNCPYTPPQHEWAIDFPRLMMRADQVLFRNRRRGLKQRLSDKALGDTDRVGKVSSLLAPLVNRAVRTPGSRVRRMMERAVGIAQERVLPPYSRPRFSTWFANRSTRLGRDRQASVALFPTCLVEYQDTVVGRDLVAVLEHNGVECLLPPGQVCCGAPLLHQGDDRSFVRQARKNIEVLATAIRKARGGGEELTVVVPEPTCGYVLKKDYVSYVGGPDAELVAEHTRDACEYLLSLHKEDDMVLDTAFPGDVPQSLTYHAPCHLRAQEIGLKSRDLLKLTGAEIQFVAECSGIDGTWGLRAENLEVARKVASKLAAAIDKQDADMVASDCTLAHGAIILETGRKPVHPVSILARAYGLADDTGGGSAPEEAR